MGLSSFCTRSLMYVSKWPHWLDIVPSLHDPISGTYMELWTAVESFNKRTGSTRKKNDGEYDVAGRVTRVIRVEDVTCVEFQPRSPSVSSRLTCQSLLLKTDREQAN